MHEIFLQKFSDVCLAPKMCKGKVFAAVIWDKLRYIYWVSARRCICSILFRCILVNYLNITQCFKEEEILFFFFFFFTFTVFYLIILVIYFWLRHKWLWQLLVSFIIIINEISFQQFFHNQENVKVRNLTSTLLFNVTRAHTQTHTYIYIFNLTGSTHTTH